MPTLLHIVDKHATPMRSRVCKSSAQGVAPDLRRCHLLTTSRHALKVSPSLKAIIIAIARTLLYPILQHLLMFRVGRQHAAERIAELFPVASLTPTPGLRGSRPGKHVGTWSGAIIPLTSPHTQYQPMPYITPSSLPRAVVCTHNHNAFYHGNL